MNAASLNRSGLLEESPVGDFAGTYFEAARAGSAQGRLAASPDRTLFEQAAARAGADRS
jgi:hypothetical protein